MTQNGTTRAYLAMLKHISVMVGPRSHLLMHCNLLCKCTDLQVVEQKHGAMGDVFKVTA